VQNGIPGTEMPGLGLTEHVSWQTAAYVRSLGRARAAPVKGDAQRGARVYEASGCGSCHVVTGRGGVLGPELTSIGALRGAALPPRCDRQTGRRASTGVSRRARGSDKRRGGPRDSRQRRRVLDPHPRRERDGATRCRSPSSRASIASSRRR
jgi:mono/diheme cytochrome c family protein